MIAATIGSTPVLAADLQTNGSQSPAGGLAYVEVPSGAQPCPNSGLGASCSNGAVATRDPGSASDAQSSLTTTNEALQPRQSTPQLELSADKPTLAAGDPALLSVSTVVSASGLPWALEIFDQTTQALVGACAQASICEVSLTAEAGAHTFIAYLAVPSSTIPVEGIRVTSNTLDVRWLGVTLAASNPSVVGPGSAVTFTATASDEVSEIGYEIELVDATTGQLLTYCSQGTTCSTSLVEPGAGTHQVVADLILAPVSFELQPTLEQSAPVSATWLSIVLSASAYPLQGGRRPFRHRQRGPHQHSVGHLHLRQPGAADRQPMRLGHLRCQHGSARGRYPFVLRGRGA